MKIIIFLIAATLLSACAATAPQDSMQADVEQAAAIDGGWTRAIDLSGRDARIPEPFGLGDDELCLRCEREPEDRQPDCARPTSTAHVQLRQSIAINFGYEP